MRHCGNYLGENRRHLLLSNLLDNLVKIWSENNLCTTILATSLGSVSIIDRTTISTSASFDSVSLNLATSEKNTQNRRSTLNREVPVVENNLTAVRDIVGMTLDNNLKFVA